MEPTCTILTQAVKEDAAIRRVQRLQPVGGPGDKIFPPTYPGVRDNDPARHLFETRRIGGQDMRCVILDSVQSQANRLEEAILDLVKHSIIRVPHAVVDFTGQKFEGLDVGDLGEITSFETPHRIFDAIIRDSKLGDIKFTDTDHYKELLKAKPTNAFEVFRVSPTSLVFGVWNSTGDGGGIGSKFTRTVVSEIVGVNAVEGQKGAVRIDPLSIRAAVKVVGGPLNWLLSTGEKGEKSSKPSEINHSNIISNLVPGGVTFDYALHTAVISCACLRRLKFPDRQDHNAGQTVLAALALVALTHQDKLGYALRSRCDLVCDGKAEFEIVHPDGTSTPFCITSGKAISILQEAIQQAVNAGFSWDHEPLRLVPQERLVQLVALSRARALEGESEDTQTE